jgi:hypothetical protein
VDVSIYERVYPNDREHLEPLIAKVHSSVLKFARETTKYFVGHGKSLLTFTVPKLGIKRWLYRALLQPQ